MMWFLWWTLYYNVVLKLWTEEQRKSFSGSSSSSESITLRALPRRIKHRCAGCYGCCCLYRHHCCGLTSRSTRETQHHLWVSECVWDLFENYHLRCLLLCALLLWVRSSTTVTFENSSRGAKRRRRRLWGSQPIQRSSWEYDFDEPADRRPTGCATRKMPFWGHYKSSLYTPTL